MGSSFGEKIYYKKGFRYLFRAHPNFFVQKSRILKNQVLWSNLHFKFRNFDNFFNLQLNFCQIRRYNEKKKDKFSV